MTTSKRGFKSSCLTQFKTSKYELKWTISNFHLYCRTAGNAIKSNIFFDESKDRLKWQLELSNLTVHREQEAIYVPTEHLSVKLDLISESQIEAYCKFSILNATNEKVNICRYYQKFSTDVRSVHIENFIKKKKLFDNVALLPKRSLTIVCSIKSVLETVNISNKPTLSTCPVSPNNLGIALLQNLEFSDVTFCVGGKELRAHKAILAVQSQVFTAMFQQHTEESQTNRIAIDDMDYDVLEEMVHFIYTNKFASLDKVSLDLLRASDKYDLQRLKCSCEEVLVQNLSEENAAEYYVVADQLDAEKLKASAKPFLIASIYPRLVITPEFKIFLEKHVEVVVEIELPKSS